MKKYLAPLWVFIGLNLLLLIVMLFMPAIGAAGDDLETDTAAMASTFWGWSWVVGSVRLWVWLGFEAAILFATAKAFLATRDR